MSEDLDLGVFLWHVLWNQTRSTAKFIEWHFIFWALYGFIDDRKQDESEGVRGQSLCTQDAGSTN